MRIAVTATQCNGKTTLINDFIQKWPMYKKSSKTYRDVIKKQNLPINQKSTPKSQKIILDCLVKEVEENTDKFVIYDRCVVDNIAYSLWHYAKKHKGFTDEFIIDSKYSMQRALSKLDIIFYLPLRKEIPIKPDENRDIDLTFREEIDNILRALVNSYEKRTGAFFPLENCPAVITLEGPPDLRLAQMGLYLQKDGTPFEAGELPLV